MTRLLWVVACATVTASCASGGRAARPRVAAGPVGETAAATLRDRSGAPVGEVQLQQAPHGVVARVRLAGVPPGEHGFHVHQVGKCEPPFDSAGGHYAPEGRKHGVANPDGMHSGDLPNVHVPAGGTVEITGFLDRVSLRGENPLLDADGSAFMVHAKPDDYRTDPAGDAGERIACGVVERR